MKASSPTSFKKATGKKADKTPGKPRRPLSAYNIFFAIERKKILCEKKLQDDDDEDQSKPSKSKGVGFANLATTVASQWKKIPPAYKKELEDMARINKMRYEKTVQEWRASRIDMEEQTDSASAMKKSDGVIQPSEQGREIANALVRYSLETASPVMSVMSGIDEARAFFKQTTDQARNIIMSHSPAMQHHRDLDASSLQSIRLPFNAKKAGTSFASADSTSFTQGQSRFQLPRAPTGVLCMNATRNVNRDHFDYDMINNAFMCVDAQHYGYATREMVSEDASKAPRS